MNSKNWWQQIIGVILLIPPIVSVLFFFLSNLGLNWKFVQMRNLSCEWTAVYGYDQGGGGGMSAAPIYLGLMAIAGAYLIKEN